VVATVMSNLGFVQAMRRADITVHQTAVGDRYVLEAMRDGGFSLGGEQSGHIIMNQHGTTGDGILTALQVLQRMARTGSGSVATSGRRSGSPATATPSTDLPGSCSWGSSEGSRFGLSGGARQVALVQPRQLDARSLPVDLGRGIDPRLCVRR